MERQSLYSIGHGNRTKEDFVQLLLQYGIKYLGDVRSVPYSKYHVQFRGNELDDYLQANGIRYVYLGDLLGGRPTDKSCYNDEGRVDYGKLQTMVFYRQGISRLKTAYEKQVPIAIMCSEKNPAMCHRSRLIGNSLLQENIILQHIDEHGALKDQHEIAMQLNKSKTILAGLFDTGAKAGRSSSTM